MFFLLISIPFVQASEESTATVNFTIANITAMAGTIKVDYTNTINFEISKTQTVSLDPSGNPTTVDSYVAEYVPTVLKIVRLVDVINSTDTPSTPQPTATPELKYGIFKPGYLIGITFVVLFIICYLYDSCCRKPGRVVRAAAPTKGKGPAKKKNHSRSRSPTYAQHQRQSDSMDSFSGAAIRDDDYDPENPNEAQMETRNRSRASSIARGGKKPTTSRRDNSDSDSDSNYI
ncbi:hypothetical protein GPJ56_004852 [Histomonas meleagridis]|uniref:uncharacterized protein n=1 Tax=Histomonas meleagridis TaxID=135588 RepID=UPI003559C4DC|nr:hypothetical protein GPJ56_004852 [Histomonas meleagridis]KAH0803503.1 hypothetical protein GO595_003847 [Histomonas meleagridis]